MVDWYKNKKRKVKDAYEKGSKYCQMLSPHIQKDLTKAGAKEVIAVIMDEIRGRHFSVLIDESRDVSIKEQMAMILRFVNDEGKVVEKFLGFKHTEKCTSAALKEALVDMLSSHKLSISMLRGQVYDGASNMRGTRWGSHVKTLLQILVMWEAILEVLEIVKKDSIKPTCNGGLLV